MTAGVPLPPAHVQGELRQVGRALHRGRRLPVDLVVDGADEILADQVDVEKQEQFHLPTVIPRDQQRARVTRDAVAVRLPLRAGGR